MTEKKFDFENIDVKLYLALKGLVKDWVGMSQDAGNKDAEEDKDYKRALLAIEEFELSHGPIPEWATGRNWEHELVPGAQLLTKDGRVSGNAHVLRVQIRKGISYTEPLYDCITDAGSYIKGMSDQDLHSQFWIGDWISDPKTLVARFGNHGEDYGIPELEYAGR